MGVGRHSRWQVIPGATLAAVVAQHKGQQQAQGCASRKANSGDLQAFAAAASWTQKLLVAAECR